MVRVESLAPNHALALAELYERAQSTCYCRFWHFTGTNNDWLARSTHAPEESRAQMLAAIHARSDEMRGAVALAGDTAVGWIKVSPATNLSKLYAQRPYRGLPCFGSDDERRNVVAIGCFLVDPTWRRRGIARALLDAAVELAHAGGAHAIEAFPRRGALLRPDEIWTGPFELFVEAGFETVHDFEPYPVLRKVLGRR